MSIQKKSLISTLKTAKKANFAAKTEGEVKSEKQVSAVSVSSARTLKSASQPTFRKTLRVI